MKLSIAEQITNARSAAGMTQDELAAALHVSRSAVSSWERGRTEPDLDTLRQLAQALNTSFTTDDVEPEAKQPPVRQPAVSARKKWWIIGIAALVVILALCIVLIVVPAIRRNAAMAKLPPAVKVAPEDLLLKVPENVTAEWFQAGNVRAEGEPWLDITTHIRSDSENYSEPFWRYGAAYREVTGLPFTLDYVEYYICWKDDETTQGADLVSTAAGGDLLVNDSEPNYWEFNCGLPVQDLIGAGYLAVGHDGADHPMSFRTYVDFTTAPKE